MYYFCDACNAVQLITIVVRVAMVVVVVVVVVVDSTTVVIVTRNSSTIFEVVELVILFVLLQMVVMLLVLLSAEYSPLTLFAVGRDGKSVAEWTGTEETIELTIGSYGALFGKMPQLSSSSSSPK